MASEISSISHLGVEVAPQTPMELAPANRELSISSALSIKCELALTFLHSLNSILPLELFLPLTKNIKSWEAANFRILGCLLYTSDAADALLCVDLGGCSIIKKKTN